MSFLNLIDRFKISNSTSLKDDSTDEQSASKCVELLERFQKDDDGNEIDLNKLTGAPSILNLSNSPSTSSESDDPQDQVIEGAHNLANLFDNLDLDTDEDDTEDDIEVAPIRYDDFAQYRVVFSKLIQMEAEYEKQELKKKTKQDVVVRWLNYSYETKIIYASFKIDDSQFDTKLVRGAWVKLGHAETKIRKRSDFGHYEYIPWVGFCTVVNVPDNLKEEEITFRLKFNNLVPKDKTTGFTFEVSWNQSNFNRTNSALKELVKMGYNVIFRKLLGKEVMENSRYINNLSPIHYSPYLDPLNESQQLALDEVIKNPLTLIQGPPGTGKTATSASIVYHFVKSGYKPALVCAPSNIAVDHLTEKIHKSGLKVVRIFAQSREDNYESAVLHLGLHNQIYDYKEIPEIAKEFKQLDKERKEKELTYNEFRRYKALKERIETEILEAADVICCTCISAGDERLEKFFFKFILIDEAVQTKEPDCIVPIVRGVEKLVLVGDQCQLGPTIKCTEAAKGGLSRSLFERLIALGNKPIRLETQYRMHPAICQFPSDTFYDGALKNGVSAAQRMLKINFPWPNPQKPMFFYCCYGKEATGDGQISKMNYGEALIVEKLVTRFLRQKMKPEQIGVVTPYTAQIACIYQQFKKSGPLDHSDYNGIEVASVDAFQGREKDIIIFSCVRSNNKKKIGFLNDVRRLNVAITRPRYGLIIVGNPNVLSADPTWKKLLNFYQDSGLLVEGHPDALKQCTSYVRTDDSTDDESI